VIGIIHGADLGARTERLLQAIVTNFFRDATIELFEVGGASLTSEKLAIDRDWHGARTIAPRTLTIFKLRAIGG